MTITHNRPTHATVDLKPSKHPDLGLRSWSQSANFNLVTVPACARCKSSSFIYVEEFIPPQLSDEGELVKLGEASYFCTRCVEYAAHAVPPMWTPEGWYAN